MSNEQNYISSLAIQDDGKIVAAGSAIVRCNTNGSLDTTFSYDGIQQGDFPIISVAVQSNGKILVAGYAGSGSNNNFGVEQYNTDGSTDLTFNKDGKVITVFSSSDDNVSGMTIFKNGKIVLIGSNYNGSILARYNTNGSLDSTFGEDGKLNDNLKQGNTEFTCVTVQKDGKIVAAGGTSNGTYNNVVTSRFNIDGSIDKTFNGSGTKITDLGASSGANAIAKQNEGKILVAAANVIRYNTNGSIDSSFGVNGIESRNFGFMQANAGQIATQHDGKIVVGYTIQDSDYNIGFLIARFNTDGSLDNVFGKGGIQTTARGLSFFIARTLALQPDEKIVVAGFNANNSEIIRFNSDGNFDNTFDDDGIQSTTFGPGDEAAHSVVVQKDGKILVQGGDRGDDGFFFLARYNINGSLDTTFSYDGMLTANLGMYGYGASVAVQDDQKIVTSATSNGFFTFLRFNENGSPDSTFGKGGTEISDLNGSRSQLNNAVISGDKLYAVGSAQFPSTFGVVARYLLTATNTPLTVSLTTPVNNATYLAPAAHIKLSATATDSDGTITKVEFYKDSTLLHTETIIPYGYVWRNVPLGNYKLTAKAYDNSGNVTTSAPVHISVVMNKAPVVNIIAPVNNQSYTAPADIHFEATASDTDGRITNVKFYNGTTLLNIQYKPPYTYKWVNAAGTYTFTAVATDNYGAQTTSAPVTITVSNAAIVSNKPYSENGKTTLNDALTLKLSPNPANKIINIYTTGLQQNKPATISIISVLGIVLKTVNIKGSMQTVPIDVSSLVSGMYTVKVISANKIMYKQFVKRQ